MKLTLREMLLSLLIVPLAGLWIADKESDRKRDAANQALIDRYRWKAESLEEAIRGIEAVERVLGDEDEISIELNYGGSHYFYDHKGESSPPPSFN